MQNNAVTIRHLSKLYKNNQKALNNIDLDIPAGEFFGLLGPNGAGKTTLIGVLTTLVNKTAGTVKIFDKDLDLDPEGAKAYMGLVPQEHNFNVFEKVDRTLINQAGFYGIPRAEAKKRAEAKLAQLGIADKQKCRVLELSGGMKRRLMIARALMHDPAILILDEPTAGVDLEIRHTLWELMQQINEQGVTVILTTHYLEEAENLCRQIAIIDHGDIVENTSKKNLLSKQQRECYTLTFQEPVESLNLDNFSSWRLDDYNHEVEINHHNNFSELFAALNRKGLTVVRISRRKTRLEELFIELTGSA